MELLANNQFFLKPVSGKISSIICQILTINNLEKPQKMLMLFLLLKARKKFLEGSDNRVKKNNNRNK